MMLKDYQGSLQDFDRANVLEPHNAFTLRTRGNIKFMLRDFQGALANLDISNSLEPNNVFTYRTRGNVKIMLNDYQGALEDLDKANVLEPNNASTLKSRGEVKRMLKDYQGALQDLDKVNVLLPNDAFVLVIMSHVHWHLNNYQLALECLDKVDDVHESNNYFIFQYNKKWLKWLLDEYQPIIESLPFNSNVKCFTSDELGTKIDVQNPLGQGLYGIVFESYWEGKRIAIKILKGVDGSFNEGAKKSFISEVRTLGSIRHINWVQLLGYCIEGTRHMLVYEYMSNSSLDKWFYNDKLNHFLDWHERMHIIIGIAKGLACLHQCNPVILHLDVKPQNILLDIDYTPKLADFGLARLLDGEQCQVCVTSIYLSLFCNDFVHMGIIFCEPYIENLFFIMPNFNFIK
jgi:tetratricopeptide (TPR) repeat protein